MKTVFFGNYYQSSKEEKEPIEWLVLDEKDGKQLLLSRYALDVKAYNEELTEVTWEICTLRQWLNEDFLNEAFSEGEKASIETSTVTADANPGFDTDPGNDTEDKIFVFSINEAVEYFASDLERACEPTDYAFSQGVYYQGDDCLCWLRSPGKFPDIAARVSSGGYINLVGNYVDYSNAVRPALWVKL